MHVFAIFQHLAALLITQQVIGQCREAMVPFFFLRRRKHQLDTIAKKTETLEKVEFNGGEVESSVQKQANLESSMDIYEVGLFIL